jgi:hypothetical protein
MSHVHDDTTPHKHDAPLFTAARQYNEAGLSTIPIRADGSKGPDLPSWKQFQSRLPSYYELEMWFGNEIPRGIAILGGCVSGSLEILDFDDMQSYQAFLEAAEATGLGPLVERIRAGCEEATPKGFHLPYYCETIEGNKKLAQRPATEDELRLKPDEKIKGLIETRGEGGYVVVAPSCGPVHASGKPYTLRQGSWLTVATITPQERSDLLALCRSFDQIPREAEPPPRQQKTASGTRPGDIFAATVPWEKILEPAGWVRVYQRGEVSYWRRPGKDSGISATTNYGGSDYFYCFSSATQFDTERGYGKFSAFAWLYHKGDFDAACSDLMRKGYTSNGAGSAHTCDMGDDEAEDEAENEWTTAQERPVEDKWPCPTHLFRGPFLHVAKAVGRYTWEVWIATLVALGAKAHRNIDYKYHRRLYGMVYALLIKDTGMGKGLSTDLCRGLMPDWYVIRDAVQSGPALAPILADIERDKKGKVISCNSHPALLLIEEFTVLLKNAGIQHSTIIDTINNLFHRTWSWNVSRTDRPNSGGGDLVIHDPALSILATTTHALFKEYVSPQMIRAGFLNRFLVLPGDTTPWKFYDPDGAGRIVDSKLGLLDHIKARKLGEGKTVWQAYAPDALERIKEWGEATFEPLMQSSGLEAESVKRLHVYAHVIGLLYAWGEQRELVNLDDVECSISAIKTAQGFLQSLIAEDRDPEVPKFKAYEISLEQKIVAKVKAEKGIRPRKVVQSLAGKSATSPDIYQLITKLVAIEVIDEVIAGRAHKLYLPEDNPERKRQ